MLSSVQRRIRSVISQDYWCFWFPSICNHTALTAPAFYPLLMGQAGQARGTSLAQLPVGAGRRKRSSPLNTEALKPYALLVGIQNEAATTENSMAVPQKVKRRVTAWSSNFNSRHKLKLMDSRPQTDISTPLFTEALSIITKGKKPPKCPSVEEWINKMCYRHTVEF